MNHVQRLRPGCLRRLRARTREGGLQEPQSRLRGEGHRAGLEGDRCRRTRYWRQSIESALQQSQCRERFVSRAASWLDWQDNEAQVTEAVVEAGIPLSPPLLGNPLQALRRECRCFSTPTCFESETFADLAFPGWLSTTVAGQRFKHSPSPATTSSPQSSSTSYLPLYPMSSYIPGQKT